MAFVHACELRGLRFVRIKAIYVRVKAAPNRSFQIILKLRLAVMQK